MVDSNFTNQINESTRKELAAFEKSKRYRFQEQCFLNYWKSHIFKKLATYTDDISTGARHRPLRYGGIKPFANPPEWYATQKKGSWVYTYDHITCIDAVKPAELISQFNQKSGAELFFRLDSSILTQLKPIVALNKIYPSETTIKLKDDGDVDEKGTNKTIRYQVPMPLGESIKADSEGMPKSRRNLSSLEELFHDHKVLGNVMLTDLNFKFAGKNIALLNTVEDISFTLSFSSFNLFTHEFKTPVPAPGKKNQTKDMIWSYQDLISYSTKYLTTESRANSKIDSETIQNDLSCYETAEQFVGAPPAADVELNETYNDKYFEIQMSIRYDPDDIDWTLVSLASTNSGGRLKLNENEKKALKSFLRNSAIILRLQFVAHTIRYNSKSSGADPELLVDFEYKAFIESSLNTPELDIFNLPGDETKKIIRWEHKLATARKLLKGAMDDKKTPGQIFGSHGQLKTHLADNYTNLRKDLESAYHGGGKPKENLLQWYIWSTIKGTASKLYKGNPTLAEMRGLIPTKHHIDVAGKAKSYWITKRGKKIKIPWQDRSVRGGLEYKPGDLESALASTGNARKIFEELVDKILEYIKLLRRAALQDKYKTFFTALYAQERVYAVELEASQVESAVGWTSPQSKKDPAKLKSATEMARERAATSTIMPLDVKIVRSYNRTGVTDLNKSLEALNTDFQNINMKRMDKNVSNQAKTLAQEIQHSLGSGLASKPSTLGKGKTPKSAIYFTNLGDIIDTAIAIASYPSRSGLFERNMGIVLGPMVERDLSSSLSTNKKYILNLAWAPISIKTLMGFFAVKVLGSGKERYLLSDFIKDIIKDLILPALGSKCVEDAQEGNQQIGAITFTSTMREATINSQQYLIPPFYPSISTGTSTAPPAFEYPPGGGAIYRIKGNIAYQFPPGEPLHWSKGGNIKDLTKVSPNTPIEKQFNYMFIYVNNISPIRLSPVKERENINNGIYYLHLGQIPSIVKQSDFRKENIPYVREARLMGRLTATGGIALRDVYSFQCTMYGNNVFKPGMLFFVDPTKDGSVDYNAWRRLGLVGFYRVIEVDHQINVGMNPIHETSLRAKWETFGDCIKEGPSTEMISIFQHVIETRSKK